MHHLLFAQVNLSTDEFQKITLLAQFEGIDAINHFFYSIFMVPTGSKTR